MSGRSWDTTRRREMAADDPRREHDEGLLLALKPGEWVEKNGVHYENTGRTYFACNDEDWRAICRRMH